MNPFRYASGADVFEYVDYNEISMGGPWVGSLEVNGHRLHDRFLLTKPVVSADGCTIALPKAYFITRPRHWEFAVIVLLRNEELALESIARFEGIEPLALDSNAVYYYPFITGGELSDKRVLEITDKTFQHVAFDFSVFQNK